MGICKRNSEIASLLGPNNIFSLFFFLFCNMLDYNNLKTRKILRLSRLLLQDSSNQFPCHTEPPFLSMPKASHMVMARKFGATQLCFGLLGRFSCYRSTSCWLSTALLLDLFLRFGNNKEAKGGFLREREIIRVGPALVLRVVIIALVLDAPQSATDTLVHNP